MKDGHKGQRLQDLNYKVLNNHSIFFSFHDGRVVELEQKMVTYSFHNFRHLFLAHLCSFKN